MCPVTTGLHPKEGKMYLQNALKYCGNVIFYYALFNAACCDR